MKLRLHIYFSAPPNVINTVSRKIKPKVDQTVPAKVEKSSRAEKAPVNGAVNKEDDAAYSFASFAHNNHDTLKVSNSDTITYKTLTKDFRMRVIDYSFL